MISWLPTSTCSFFRLLSPSVPASERGCRRLNGVRNMPGPPEHQDQPLIMVVGMGDLSTRLLNMLLADPATSRLVLAGRDVDAIRRRANLARFAAMNLGVIGRTEVKHVDLNNVAATAEA